MGMTTRKHLIIDKNPVMPHVFVSKLRRPSNQKGFEEAGGLKDILCALYLEEFLRDPLECRKSVIFCKNEEDLISVYEFIEDAVGDKFKNLKTCSGFSIMGLLEKIPSNKFTTGSNLQTNTLRLNCIYLLTKSSCS
jgi:hypothetical protein